MLKNAAYKILLPFIFLLLSTSVKSQVTDSLSPISHPVVPNNDTIHLPPEDTIYLKPVDTLLRIKNFSPNFTLHVDSTLDYRFEINKNPYNYYWYLKNAPVGLQINKDNGVLHFKAEKSYFLSGKLKYDTQYKVRIGVQNLNDP
ncbi:MAG: hypothetical protein ACTHJN_07835, partial [Ginsengibacter sp.]